MMSCCKKAKSGDQSPAADNARLCCAVNCTDPASTPSGPSGLPPVVLKVTESVAERIATLVQPKRVSSKFPYPSENRTPAREHRPLFLRHHSFLI